MLLGHRVVAQSDRQHGRDEKRLRRHLAHTARRAGEARARGVVRAGSTHPVLEVCAPSVLPRADDLGEEIEDDPAGDLGECLVGERRDEEEVRLRSVQSQG